MPKIQKILFIIMAVPLACLVCIGYGEGGRFRTKLLLRWGVGECQGIDYPFCEENTYVANVSI